MRKIILALVLILASIKFCFAATLFQDTFSTDNLDNWSIAAGAWNVENGELKGIGAGGAIDGWIYAGDDSWGNYDFEAKANLLEGEAEFVFRSTGHWINEYRLELWSASAGIYENTFVLSKYQNGTGYVLSNGHQLSPVPITDTLLGRVSVVDDNINIFINNQKIFEYQDNNPLLNGKIGLGVIWAKQGSFDNVLVSNSVVPEPTSMLLFGVGGLVLAALKRKKRG